MTPSATHRPLVLAAVMAANFMIAIEATIVSTAMPQIVGQLGGLPLYSWVFSAFLLTQTATTVVFGKLSDLIGRKTVMLVGIAIFLVRLDLMRVRLVDAVADRLPARAGHRRGRGSADRHDHRRRPLFGA